MARVSAIESGVYEYIEPDSRWKASIQLGTQYAALLVDPTFNLPEQTESLPIVGNGVVALAAVNGEGPAPVLPSPKTLTLAVTSGRRAPGQFSALGQETFSILRTFGRTKEARCIFVFREARKSGLRRR